ncbi:TetR/AcrR family transcriptional regulator [Streptomyces tagetis]|uniref:TetR/AcrR family transcriptional regulator n=1 Tax=Streptomyces tagetis TaxID=2820809 RepID=A0A940XAI9_9ACTN|nr:TetR/AcrR family transcriptional regulator [Streptomyces sp. RG38]MBQ0826623.1 TetR/AcrR family transcriptional regulator [Streptomyces sp. RG38]
MARWEPHARQRLADAALELFAERGYEETTVLDIARRAGLAKSTFFRHFQDKRGVLFAEDAPAGPLVAAIAAAPAQAGPLDAVEYGLDALGRDVFTADRRPFTLRRRAVIEAHPDLREREALKEAGLTAAMGRAIAGRGVPGLAARVTAELGGLALKAAYERWSDPAGTEDFGDIARQTLDEIRSAVAEVRG